MKDVECSEIAKPRRVKDIVVLFIFFLASLAIVSLAAYQYGGKKAYRDGYETGSYHTMLYHETTDLYPSESWRDSHFDDDIQSESDIMDTFGEISE